MLYGFSGTLTKNVSTGECPCSSKPQNNNVSSASTSASSIQTQIHSKKSTDSVLSPDSPHQLLGLGVSLSSPNLLNSAVSLMLSSSSESVSVRSYFERFGLGSSCDI